jgi:hypothetical protein
MISIAQEHLEKLGEIKHVQQELNCLICYKAPDYPVFKPTIKHFLHL